MMMRWLVRVGTVKTEKTSKNATEVIASYYTKIAHLFQAFFGPSHLRCYGFGRLRWRAGETPSGS
jgi:hypothetical protein